MSPGAWNRSPRHPGVRGLSREVKALVAGETGDSKMLVLHVWEAECSPQNPGESWV